MALHLNLHHEIQAAHLARQRDPLKLGLYLLVAIAICFVGFYFLRLGTVHSVTSKRDAIREEWLALEPKQKEAAARAEILSGTVETTRLLVNHIEGRFHWAPLLSRIGSAVPQDVQLTRISADRKTESSLQLTVEGISSGAEPRTIAEDLRTTLATALATNEGDTADAAFVSLDDGEESVSLNGKNWPTAIFTIRTEVKMSQTGTESASLATAP